MSRQLFLTEPAVLHPPTPSVRPRAAFDCGALFWGRARWAVPDDDMCFDLKGLGCVRDDAVRCHSCPFSGRPRALHPLEPASVDPRHRCPLTGDGGVGKPLGIPEGPRSRLTPPPHLFRESQLPLCGRPAHVLEHFRAIFLLVSAEEELKCFRK